MPSSACKKNALRSEEHTSELQSHDNLVCRLLLEKNERQGARRPPAGGAGDPAPVPAGHGARVGPSGRVRGARAPRGSAGVVAFACFFFLRGGGPGDSPLFPLRPPFRG